MSTHKLIITADDYGMSKAVNRAIDEGIQAGLITSTNVMTNMEYYMEAKKLRNMNVSVGLHWVLSCGKPVEAVNKIPSLVNSEGTFYSYPEFRKRYRKGLISDEEIEKELVAQYNRFRDVLGEPDYWNTHQNVHVDFKIYALFVRVALKLNIHRMRSHQRIYAKEDASDGKRPLVWRIMEPAKSKLLDCWQNNAHKKGIASPEGLIVWLGEADSVDPHVLFSRVQWKKHQVGEYVIHPATENDSPYFGKIVDQRMREYKLFTSDKTKQVLKQAEIQLVNYSVL